MDTFWGNWGKLLLLVVALLIFGIGLIVPSVEPVMAKVLFWSTPWIIGIGLLLKTFDRPQTYKWPVVLSVVLLIGTCLFALYRNHIQPNTFFKGTLKKNTPLLIEPPATLKKIRIVRHVTLVAKEKKGSYKLKILQKGQKHFLWGDMLDSNPAITPSLTSPKAAFNFSETHEDTLKNEGKETMSVEWIAPTANVETLDIEATHPRLPKLSRVYLALLVFLVFLAQCGAWKNNQKSLLFPMACFCAAFSIMLSSSNTDPSLRFWFVLVFVSCISALLGWAAAGILRKMGLGRSQTRSV